MFYFKMFNNLFRYIHQNSKSSIKWDHYSQVLKCDTITMLKICPKITRQHLELNNMTKMKVKFATQVYY